MKKALIYSFSIATILMTALIVHLALVLPDDVDVDNANIQLSTFKFNESLDNDKAQQIYEDLNALKGIKSTKFNIEKGVVLYYFDNNILNSGDVENYLKHKTDVSFNKYSLSEEFQNKKSCPAIVDNSFSKKLIYAIQKIF